MKKQILAIALIGSLTMATVATANWGKNCGQGYADCPQMQGQYQQLDQATQDKIKQFFSDNQGLRKEMMMKQAEKRALMRSDNPDPQLAAKVAGELFDLRTSLRAKAVEAGVDQYVGKGQGRMGGGGKHHGNRMGKMQNCNNN